MNEPVVIGDATLYLGDCRDVLPTLPMVDAVVTDPPYSEPTHRNAKSNRNGGFEKKAIDFDSMSFEDLCQIFSLIAWKCDQWVVATMDWRHIADIERSPPCGLELVRFGVWLKTNPMPQISADRPAQGWEGIAYMHRVIDGRKRWNGGGKHGNYIGPVLSNGSHPTGKPIQMISEFVRRFSDAGRTVLDPFMGSGTTGVAAIQLGRKFIGIEREPKYFDIACERISRAVAQGRLFEPERPQQEQDVLL